MFSAVKSTDLFHSELSVSLGFHQWIARVVGLSGTQVVSYDATGAGARSGTQEMCELMSGTEE